MERGAIFCVAVDLSGDEPRWIVCCERCGDELDVASQPPMTVIRLPGLAGMLGGPDAEHFARRIQALQANRSIGRTIVLDAEAEVTHLALEERLLSHARECGQLESAD